MPAAKLTAALREDVERLCRKNLSGPNAPLARSVLEALRLPPPPRRRGLLGLLALWVRDAEGLPERPWRVQPHDPVSCVTLDCTVPAHVCVARQLASDAQRTRDTWRGQGSEYPSCVTARCAQGRGIREALEPGAKVAWRGEGPGGRLSRLRSDLPEQHAARTRLAVVGLTEAVSTVDGVASAVELEEGGEA
jgi:hypothetical protein